MLKFKPGDFKLFRVHEQNFSQISQVEFSGHLSLRERCPYWKFFWSAFPGESTHLNKFQKKKKEKVANGSVTIHRLKSPDNMTQSRFRRDKENKLKNFAQFMLSYKSKME